MATDDGVPIKLNSEAKLRINVRLSEEHPSYFKVNAETLSFTGNANLVGKCDSIKLTFFIRHRKYVGKQSVPSCCSSGQ